MATAAIIGGGIGGLATAALLAQRGWEVEIFERAASLPTTGTALGMWPEAMAVLEQVGAAALAGALGTTADFDGDPTRALRAYEAERRRAGQRTMLLSRVMRHVALASRLRGPRDLFLRAVAAAA